jgi:hypothetical protein
MFWIPVDGSPAVSERPVAFRPALANGLAFSSSMEFDSTGDSSSTSNLYFNRKTGKILLLEKIVLQ